MKRIKPADVLAGDPPADPQRAARELSAREVLIIVLTALTGNRLLTRRSRRTERRVGRLRAASRLLATHLDPDGVIRRARALAIVTSGAAHLTATSLLDSSSRVRRSVKVATIAVIAGLEAVFVATFFFAYVKQGRSWISLEGVVSLLVGLVHPLVVLLVSEAVEAAVTRVRRRRARLGYLTGAGIFAGLDAVVVLALTRYIVGTAVQQAVDAGLPLVGFPGWVFALLFALLPLALIGMAVLSADRDVAAHEKAAAAGRRARRQRRRAWRRLRRRADRVERRWLGLFRHLADSVRALAVMVHSGEYGLLEARSSTGGPGAPAQPGAQVSISRAIGATEADQVAAERATLVREIIPWLDVAVHHVGFDHVRRLFLSDLQQAALALLDTPVPSLAVLLGRADTELGGPAAVADPACFTDFRPNGAGTHAPVPDAAGTSAVPDATALQTAAPNRSGPLPNMADLDAVPATAAEPPSPNGARP